jgi:hypothetical protein
MAHFTDTHDSHPIMNPQDARQGVTLGHVRYVLGFSLTLAILAGIVVYFSFV